MPAICTGGGTASARPGFAELLFVGPAVIGAALNNIPTPQAMLIAGIVGALTYELSTFCPSGPPPLPTITLDDIAALFQPLDVVRFFPARQKFQDLIANYIWPTVCQCDSGAQPSIPTAPTALVNFSGTPAIAPSVSVTGCYTHNRTFAVEDIPFITLSDGTHLHMVTDLFGLLQGPDLTVSGASGPVHRWLIPNGATHFSYTITCNANCPSVADNESGGVWYDASGNFITGFSVNFPTLGNTASFPTTAIPAGARSFQFNQNHSGNPDRNMTIVWTWYCNSQTGASISQPCCPPDATLTAQIAAILGYVQLLQRQTAPFAYIDGTPATGLSGHGTLTVQGILGARVTITTFPTNVGIESGDPDVVFDAGWINFGDANGFSARRFINASPIQFFPEAAGQFTRIGYSLAAGVVATITPILREP